MASRIEFSLAELAEHERAAEELARLRRKGIPCHLENHPEGSQSHVNVVRDDREPRIDQSDAAMASAASMKEG